MPPNLAVLFRKVSIAGLFVLVITSVFSLGYNNFDEHFQILEFCNYKMGFTPASQLAWEYHEQIRPALQPFMAYAVASFLNALNLYNPFTVAFILRFCTALLTWLVARRLVPRLMPAFNTESGKKIFIWSSFFLWFVAYVGVRFSAENLSGIFFFLAISLLPGIDNKETKSQKIALAGLLLGFALFLRIQIGFAFVGLAVWGLFLQKWKWNIWLWLIAGGIVAAALSIAADYWLYGEWLLTPLKYIDVNLFQNKASEFGTSPVWQYFISFIESAVPPLSIVLLVLILLGTGRRPLHLFSLMLIPFFIGHSLVAHKEMRFLFPMMFAVIFLACQGFDYFMDKYRVRRIYRWLFVLALVANFGTLLYRMFSPAENRMSLYKFVYHYAQQYPTVLIAHKQSPYNVVTLETNFYKHPNLEIYTVENSIQLDSIRNNVKAGKHILFFSPDLKPAEEFSQLKMKRVFAQFPEWVLHINFNNWQERTSIQTLYEID
jgi:GPI mannosyltransferase 3